MTQLAEADIAVPLEHEVDRKRGPPPGRKPGKKHGGNRKRTELWMSTLRQQLEAFTLVPFDTKNRRLLQARLIPTLHYGRHAKGLRMSLFDAAYNCQRLVLPLKWSSGLIKT